MELTLSPDEAAVLAEVLDSALGDLREEIYKSEVADYKTALKQREVILHALIARLGARPSLSS